MREDFTVEREKIFHPCTGREIDCKDKLHVYCDLAVYLCYHISLSFSWNYGTLPFVIYILSGLESYSPFDVQNIHF